MQSRHLKLLAAATLTAWSLTAGLAQAAGVLTIGCREDSTTFDPIKARKTATPGSSPTSTTPWCASITWAPRWSRAWQKAGTFQGWPDLHLQAA